VRDRSISIFDEDVWTGNDGLRILRVPHDARQPSRWYANVHLQRFRRAGDRIKSRREVCLIE